MRIGWLVNENHFVMTSPFRNGSHFQPPNARVRILWILLRNAMAAAEHCNTHTAPTGTVHTQPVVAPGFSMAVGNMVEWLPLDSAWQLVAC
jgi:hypothetical protein